MLRTRMRDRHCRFSIKQSQTKLTADILILHKCWPGNLKRSFTLPLPGIKTWPLSLQSSALASQPRIPMTCHTVATFYGTRPTPTFILSSLRCIRSYSLGYAVLFFFFLFFLAWKDYGRKFDEAFLACAFFLFFFSSGNHLERVSSTL